MVHDAPPGKILADSFDILVPDIKPEDLATTVSLKLGCKYLSPAANERLPEVAGTLYGVNNRSMFTLPVTCNELTLNVHFLFDTGAPATYLASSALAAWGLQPCNRHEAHFKINGYTMRLFSSGDQWRDEHGAWHDSHFKGINVLGVDFLLKADAEFWLCAREHKCRLVFQ